MGEVSRELFPYLFYLLLCVEVRYALMMVGLFRDKDYCSFYTEKWADELTGIEC